MWKYSLSTGLILVLLCGCLQTKDELTINADGTGKVHIETRTSIPPELAGSIAGQMGSDRVAYPPISEAEARVFFPGKDFNITTKQEQSGSNDVTTIIDVEFQDINALLTSPYGQAHQLDFRIKDGALVVKGITGMEAAARYSTVKDETGLSGMSGLEDMQKKKNEMSDEFRITLPNTIISGNGTNSGKSEIWTAKRAQCKDDEEFARKLAGLVEVRCSAEGLKFSPVVPVRLSLQPFSELTEGATGGKGSGVDTNKILSAAKFVPYGMSVTRSLDLSGEGGGGGSQAELIGAIIIPAEFLPQKWGEVKLEEALDAKGNDLKPRESARGNSYFRGSRYRSMENDEDAHTNTIGEQRHVVSLDFRPPDWKVNEIAKIRGSAVLQYFGGAQVVVKLTNAVPAGAIIDMSKMMAGGFNSSERALGDQVLSDLGLSISTGMCMSQGGMCVLSLQVKGTTATLSDAQVFDADGKPWPTVMSQTDTGEMGTCQVMVVGKPQPPWSLAFLANGGGSTVEVPIEVDNVSVAQKQ